MGRRLRQFLAPETFHPNVAPVIVVSLAVIPSVITRGWSCADHAPQHPLLRSGSGRMTKRQQRSVENG